MPAVDQRHLLEALKAARNELRVHYATNPEDRDTGHAVAVVQDAIDRAEAKADQ